jgi:hypothetical protein
MKTITLCELNMICTGPVIVLTMFPAIGKIYVGTVLSIGQSARNDAWYAYWSNA